jgi:hypothetical protein
MLKHYTPLIEFKLDFKKRLDDSHRQNIRYWIEQQWKKQSQTKLFKKFKFISIPRWHNNILTYRITFLKKVNKFEKEINIGLKIVPHPFEVYTRVKIDPFNKVDNNKNFEFGHQITYFKMTPNE